MFDSYPFKCSYSGAHYEDDDFTTADISECRSDGVSDRGSRRGPRSTADSGSNCGANGSPDGGPYCRTYVYLAAHSEGRRPATVWGGASNVNEAQCGMFDSYPFMRSHSGAYYDDDDFTAADMCCSCAVISATFVAVTCEVAVYRLLGQSRPVTGFGYDDRHVRASPRETVPQSRGASWPSLLWVLRDFYLELADQHGAALTADEYLEQALHEGPEEHRGVREDLRRLFTSRSCATLARPAADEEQLQALDSLPYEQLRPEFRQSLEELSARLLAECRANPKSAGGRPLSCASLVALARRLVSSLNEGRVVSLRGAWESVQHDACGALADELREQGCSRLRALQNGEQLEDGAALPMADEALGAVLAQLRHQLRKQWTERALGEEGVQQEYWQDLEASLDREEVLLRAHNDRVGDLQLTEALKEWQVWVIDPSGTWQAGDPLARRFRAQMERTPSAALARGAGVALEATGRRLVMAREALAAAQAERAAGSAREGESASAEMRRLAAELEAQRAENERLKAQLGEVGARRAAGLSEEQEQLQAEREARKKSKERAVVQLMESQQKSGRLEGQMQVMEQELASLRERGEELQRAAVEAAGQKALHEAERERLQRELDEAAASAERWRAEAEQHSEAAAAGEGAAAAATEVHGPATAHPACCSLQ
ncbi:unnamed protein product [Prorocentrum cordatum]|uniref:Guanylate-binding protein N-terminal domain-containing protein n=1 Tax=Prorocentrum cordatum TaxID=2364126 RepID=A0ABN9SYB5_9DINO|nr:unnamed protein product [Polarella glacialis]